MERAPTLRWSQSPSPDDEDQKRIVTKPMMSHHRLDDERRPTDYLRNEFRNRVSAEVVRYRLQIQLYEWKAGDTDEVFNANKAWGTPFLDLGVITLHTPMNDWEVEQTSFNIANCPRCISLVKPVNAHDYHTINWTRRGIREVLQDQEVLHHEEAALL